jgi:hypothetical protein
MVAVKAAVTKTVSAQPGSAGSNPFSTVNVSPFLWCVPARPRRANPSHAFSPRAPEKPPLLRHVGSIERREI